MTNNTKLWIAALAVAIAIPATLIGVQVLGYQDIQIISAPGNPASGFLRLSAQTGTLGCLTSSGANCLNFGSGSVTSVVAGTCLSGGTITTTGTIASSGSCYVAGGGTANAQTATYSPAFSALAAGQYLCWLPSNANTTTTPTFSPNSLTAKTIVKVGGSALAASDLTTSAVACAIYDGTDWELQNPQTSSGGGGSVTSISAGTCLTGGTITSTGTIASIGSCYASGGGTANVQTATYSPAFGSLVTGMNLCWTPSNANTTTTPTFNPNSLGAATITKVGGVALAASDLTTTAIACAIYDGTDWELQNPQTVSSGGSGALTQLAQTTLASATSSITFSGISGAYSSLSITIVAQSACSCAADFIIMQANGDGSNDYSWSSTAGAISGTPSQDGGNTSSVPAIGTATGNSGTGCCHGSATQVSMPGYAGTTFAKYASYTNGYSAGDPAIANSSGAWVWESNSAITALKFTLGTGSNFSIGTQITIYGMQ
jgi:hypothetical protein